MARVKLEHLRKVYGTDTVAVHDANFEIADGEFVVLVGPSGCGKSTTLRMIAGLETITDGSLYIGERVVNGLTPKERDIAMVFQNYALYPHMTVYDNMAFGLKLRKMPKAEIEERVREAARILSIEPILERKPGQLSGGQRQRVAVGRAIVREPQVFLFDEPLSNLDAKLRTEMRTEIAKLHTQLGATMVYVTHDQTEAMTMGDRIVVLKDGHVQQVDTPLNLYNHPTNRFVAGFIGSPSMNLVDGQITRGGRDFVFRAAGGAITVPVPEAHAHALAHREGQAVTLGIRPEDIRRAGSARADRPSAEVRLVLDVIEPMGNEIVIYAQAEGLAEAIIARLAPQELPEPNEEIVLAFDLSKLHFFDGKTGRAIRERQASESAA